MRVLLRHLRRFLGSTCLKAYDLLRGMPAFFTDYYELKKQQKAGDRLI